MNNNKNILLISTCFHKLHEFEFVKPIENIILNLNNDNNNRISYSTVHINSNKLNEESFIKTFSHIIICGTALKDFEYLHSNYNEFLKICELISIPVLGICAGAQLISKYLKFKLYENKKNNLIEIEIINSCTKLEIIKNKCIDDSKNRKNIQVYALHSYTLKNIHHSIINNILTILMIEKESNFIEFAKFKTF
ncbi:MAG: hypothetical protein LAT82_03465, partial [Nanoarchaeota archaeon]|nr:hypothetical protein [Nanoarchaeota archaeon]